MLAAVGLEAIADVALVCGVHIVRVDMAIQTPMSRISGQASRTNVLLNSTATVWS